MCEKKIIVLKQQLIKPARPVQTVTPEPAKPLQASPQIIKPGRVLKKANTMPKVYWLVIIFIITVIIKFPLKIELFLRRGN